MNFIEISGSNKMLKRIVNGNFRFWVIVLWQMVAYVEMAGNETHITELECLRDLPVEHLLKIRRALQVISAESIEEATFDNDKFSMKDSVGAENGAYVFNRSDITALPLIGQRFRQKVGYQPETWEEEKPSKIQKIFQLSVTALAFLAFSGYLLCMIVQAIKSKGATYYYPALQPMVSTTSDPNERPIRFTRLRRHASTIHNSTEFDGRAEPSPEDLYKVLIMAAEGYVRLNRS